MASKRSTVYFDPEMRRVLRLKAPVTDRSISNLVNQAVGLAFWEDADDLKASEQRRNEPTLRFEDVVKDLRQRGRI